MIGDSCWRNDVTLRVVTSWVVERLSNPGGGKALRYNGPRRPQEAPGAATASGGLSSTPALDRASTAPTAASQGRVAQNPR